MKTLFTLMLIFLTAYSWANINYIKFHEVPNYNSYLKEYDFIKENQGYYNHWQPEWTYEVSKKSLIKELKNCYKTFSNLTPQNVELNLLLGDIAHYLYNLEEKKYFEKAESHYLQAISQEPENYRPVWFLANHYALSNISEKAIEQYQKCLTLLPENEPAAFWEEFAFSTLLANMPSHCIMAMQKAKDILGEPSYLEEQMGETIYNRIEPIDADSNYHFMDIWTASEGEFITFTCRPLGMKMLVDSTWNINFYHYQNRASVVTIVPPAIKNKAGRDITYTIALLVKVADQEESLENYTSQLIKKYPNKSMFSFSEKYPDMVAYNITDSSMYQDIGGAHMHLVGLSREVPQFPGVLLEKPMQIPGTDKKGLNVYRASGVKDRFQNPVFYAIIFDACEDIYDEAYSVFKTFFEHQVVIE